MILIVVKVLFEARLQWRGAFMKLRIELREFTLECCCHEFFDGLRVRACAAEIELARFTEHGLLAMCSKHPKCNDGLLQPLGAPVLKKL